MKRLPFLGGDTRICVGLETPCIIYQMTQPPGYGQESQVYTITVAQITGGDNKSLEVNLG